MNIQLCLEEFMHAFVNCLLAQIISMLVSGIVQILAVQMDTYSHTDVLETHRRTEYGSTI